MYGVSLALYVSQTIVNSSTHEEQIYELLQGRVLFRGRPSPKDAWTVEEDQIAQMVEQFGPVPSFFRKSGKLSSKYFDDDKNGSMSGNDYEQFEAFLRAMLQYEPSERKTPKELLKEPWLSNEILALNT